MQLFSGGPKLWLGFGALGALLLLSFTALNAMAADRQGEGTAFSTSASPTLNGQLGGEPAPSLLSQIPNLLMPPDAKSRRLHFEFLNWTTFKAANANSGLGQTGVQNYAGCNYRIGETSAISIRQPFTYNYEFPQTLGSSTDVHASDLYVEYQNSKLLEFWKSAKVNLISARIGLPTGEESRFVTKTNGYAFGWVEAVMPLSSSVNFNWHLRSAVYNQTNNTYIDPNDFAAGFKGTKDYGVDEMPEIEWKINKTLSVTHATGTSHMHYRSGPSPLRYIAEKQDFQISSWSSFNVQASSQLAFTLALSNGAELYPEGRDFGFFRSDETSYHLFVSATI